MSTPASALTQGHVRTRRNWMAVVRRAAFYTLPLFVIEIHVFQVALVPWAMFLAFLPVAAYRVMRAR